MPDIDMLPISVTDNIN